MERQIKFRGISRDTGKWLVGALIPNGKKEAYIAPFGRCLQLEEVDPDTVGQFTGLLDKNGKEIYEGDIIRIDCHPWLDCKELESVNAEVFFEDCLFSVRWKNPDAGRPIPFYPDNDPEYESEYIGELLANLPNTIEVIGNRFDNPELISDKQ